MALERKGGIDDSLPLFKAAREMEDELVPLSLQPFAGALRDHAVAAVDHDRLFLVLEPNVRHPLKLVERDELSPVEPGKDEVIPIPDINELESARSRALHDLVEFFRGDFHGRVGLKRAQ
jgi:hypothetical protein